MTTRPTRRRQSAGTAKAASLEVGERLASSLAPSLPTRRLDVFANPAADRDYAIRFEIPEFTCNCPLTGQPDFAQFLIDMVPDRLCVELKSLKLYFWSYRDEAGFHEKVTNAVLDDLVAAARPRYARVAARWNVRGGIRTDVVVEYRKKGWAAMPPAPIDRAAT
jgi:7-cyano-7-deazaguanine reductase